MNIANKLLDKEFIEKFLVSRVLPKYSDFKKISSIKIIPHKKSIWDETYHVVIEYLITLEAPLKAPTTIPIFCSAHSDEPRKNVYSAMKYLWDNGFAEGSLTVPRPLFYSNYFRATFYRGVKGRNLYRFIREKDFKTIEQFVLLAADWYAKLHNLPVDKAKNFNKQNSRIRTVIPGVKHILESISHKHPNLYTTFNKAYSKVIESERIFLDNTEKRWIIHGDAHPENVIKMGENKLGMIDFTDISLSDFARDVGSFMQQIEFMCNRKIDDKEYGQKIKQLFLDRYLKTSGQEMTESIEARINNYYVWTAMRTATFFLIKDKPDPKRAFPLVDKFINLLKI